MLPWIDAFAMSFVLKATGLRRTSPDVFVRYLIRMFSRHLDVAILESARRFGGP